MLNPLQVTFRDLPPSDAVTAHVERRAQKLDTFFDRLTSCHVVLSEPHRRHRHGKRYEVTIDMHVPGRTLVVSRNSDDDKEDLHATVDGAFGDAERMLESYARKLKLGPRTPHERPPHGVVTKVFAERGYGFIEDGGREIYFHKNAVVGDKFDKLSVGAKVRYAEEDGDLGPQASSVYLEA